MSETTPKPGASLSLRLTPEAEAELAALVAAVGPLVPRHRLAVEALRVGARALKVDPGALFGSPRRAATLAERPLPDAAVEQVVAPPPPVEQPAAPVEAPPPPPVEPPPVEDDPKRSATPAELVALRRAVKAAKDAGVSLTTQAAAGGITSGPGRGRLRAVLEGCKVAVTPYGRITADFAAKVTAYATKAAAEVGR